MCCGNNRAAARAAVMAQATRPAAAVFAAAAPSMSVIMFEYLGNSPASIRGPVSGQVYRFAHAGQRLPVDARDRPGLAAMAALRWVR